MSEDGLLSAWEYHSKYYMFHISPDISRDSSGSEKWYLSLHNSSHVMIIRCSYMSQNMGKTVLHLVKQYYNVFNRPSGHFCVNRSIFEIAEFCFWNKWYLWFKNCGNFEVLSLSCKSYCQVYFDFGGLRFLQRVLEYLKQLSE